MELEQSQMYQTEADYNQPEPKKKKGSQSFAEQFSKYKLRDYKDNTRMNIKNQDYQNQSAKRERMVKYWQQ